MYGLALDCEYIVPESPIKLQDFGHHNTRTWEHCQMHKLHKTIGFPIEWCPKNSVSTFIGNGGGILFKNRDCFPSQTKTVDERGFRFDEIRGVNRFGKPEIHAKSLDGAELRQTFLIQTFTQHNNHQVMFGSGSC